MYYMYCYLMQYSIDCCLSNCGNSFDMESLSIRIRYETLKRTACVSFEQEIGVDSAKS